MTFLLCTLNGFLWSFLRRWFGGLFSDDVFFLGNRGVQTIAMILCTIPLFWYSEYKYIISFCIALAISLWVQFQHWSRAVGCILDSGRDTTPDLTRYDRWYRVVLDWVYDGINKILSKVGISYQLKKYQGYYDFWYTAMRFACPLMLLAPITWWYSFIGFLAAPIYFLSHRIFETWPELYIKLPSAIREPKDLAEAMYGFTFGFGFTLLFKIFIAS